MSLATAMFWVLPKWIPSIFSAHACASNFGATDTSEGWRAATFANAASTYVRDVAILLGRVVVGARPERRLVGVAPPVVFAANDRHEVDPFRAGSFGSDGGQRGFEVRDPVFFGGELPAPGLVDERSGAAPPVAQGSVSVTLLTPVNATGLHA